MSQENVEIVRRFVDVYNRRDFEGMIELIDPTFEFRSALRCVGVGLPRLRRISVCLLQNA
jgi:hypothetical protein